MGIIFILKQMADKLKQGMMSSDGWKAGTFSCFEDLEKCCWISCGAAFWIKQWEIAKKSGHHKWATCLGNCCGCHCIPRHLYAEKAGIDEGWVKSCLCGCCCACCSGVQMWRDAEERFSMM